MGKLMKEHHRRRSFDTTSHTSLWVALWVGPLSLILPKHARYAPAHVLCRVRRRGHGALHKIIDEIHSSEERSSHQCHVLQFQFPVAGFGDDGKVGFDPGHRLGRRGHGCLLSKRSMELNFAPEAALFELGWVEEFGLAVARQFGRPGEQRLGVLASVPLIEIERCIIVSGVYVG